MKKTLHKALLFLFLLVCLQSKAQQLLYQNNSLGNRIYNPGFGSGDTPKVIFDDINFASSLTNSFDSIVISQATVAIGRAPNSPAVTVKVYVSAPDTLHDSLNSLPALPPKLIGTLNLPQGGNSGFFTIGDNSTPLAAFKIDTGRFLKGYQTLYLGLSFSDSVQSDIGWYLSNGPDTNYDLIYKYDITRKDSPVIALNLYGTYNLPATFYAVVNGTFKNAVILPVVLNNFKVSRKGDENMLTWQTQTESNSNYFIIERSGDGQHFKTIGQVNAAGFSNKTLNYQFTDASPLAGTNYYRLQLTDKDNKSTYSNIARIANQLQSGFTINPNPVRGNSFTTKFTAVNADYATLQIMNANGKTVYSKQINVVPGSNNVTVTDVQLSAGIYYITISNNEIKYTGKLEKQ